MSSQTPNSGKGVLAIVAVVAVVVLVWLYNKSNSPVNGGGGIGGSTPHFLLADTNLKLSRDLHDAAERGAPWPAECMFQGRPYPCVLGIQKGAAHLAGLRPGDLLLACDGLDCSRLVEQNALEQGKAQARNRGASSVPVTIYRSGQGTGNVQLPVNGKWGIACTQPQPTHLAQAAPQIGPLTPPSQAPRSCWHCAGLGWKRCPGGCNAGVYSSPDGTLPRVLCTQCTDGTVTCPVCRGSKKAS